MTQPTASDVHIEILEPIDQTQVPADYIIRLRASASVESATGTKDLGDRIRWRATTAGGDPVDIRLIAKGDEQTDLRIRIGVFGNEARSRLVLEQIRQAL